MNSLPPITVRPILYTEHVDAYLHIFTALGMSTLMRTPGWTLVAGKAGRVAMHSTMSGRIEEGTVHLGFEVADLTAYAEAIAPTLAQMTVSPPSRWRPTKDRP
jgi:hypothetical protein